MKKLLVCLLALLMLVGCTSNNGGNKEELSLTEVVDKVLEGLETPDYDAAEITDEKSYPYCVYTEYKEGYQLVMADALINACAHTVVVLKVTEGTDVAAVAKEVFDNADEMKWLCVLPEQVGVIYSGDTIVLVMSSKDIVSGVFKNFQKLYSDASEGWTRDVSEGEW